MMGVLPMQLTANPMRAGPAFLAKRLVVTVKLATAIAQHCALRRRGEEVTVWRDAVLKWHWLWGA